MEIKRNYLIFENSKELYFLIENVKRKIMGENKIIKYTKYNKQKRFYYDTYLEVCIREENELKIAYVSYISDTEFEPISRNRSEVKLTSTCDCVISVEGKKIEMFKPCEEPEGCLDNNYCEKILKDVDVVKGNTYLIRYLLKNLGFSWEPRLKYYVKNKETTDKIKNSDKEVLETKKAKDYILKELKDLKTALKIYLIDCDNLYEPIVNEIDTFLSDDKQWNKLVLDGYDYSHIIHSIKHIIIKNIKEKCPNIDNEDKQEIKKEIKNFYNKIEKFLKDNNIASL